MGVPVPDGKPSDSDDRDNGEEKEKEDSGTDSDEDEDADAYEIYIDDPMLAELDQRWSDRWSVLHKILNENIVPFFPFMWVHVPFISVPLIFNFYQRKSVSISDGQVN